MAPSIFAVCGGLNMDIVMETDRIPYTGESMDTNSLANFPGGKGANTAVAAYRASHLKSGSPARGVAAEGSSSSSVDDRNKQEVRVFMNVEDKTRLVETGVDVSGVLKADGEPSGTCVVMVERSSGESRNLAYQGAILGWKPRDDNSVLCLAGGEKPDIIICHLGIPAPVVGKLLVTAGKQGVDTILNPSPASTIASSGYKNLTHLVMNESEAAELTDCNVEELKDRAAWEKAAKYFIRLGVKNVVITLGARGSYYVTKEGKEGEVAAVQNVDVKDATGAGDTFVANYTLEYVTQKKAGEWDIVKAIDRACKASAKIIQRFGAQDNKRKLSVFHWDNSTRCHAYRYTLHSR
ncbi:Ribokinase-like protein [Mollisia scopiformis]|uniref:Ribokinase-like protein n=1 Tax=Mollisia scopiformis TaxID=149040 RepID=A0A194XGX9_MOLSC|nr:Ribokinase-like protein [Mollisia scopiformis]KUJ19455.1 Ribokinase-like protein [Mollisia scopiformis]